MKNNDNVSPWQFSEAMRDHWLELGNVANESLVKSWEQTGATFGMHIFNTDEDRAWTILQQPTGTGKSQAIALYSAMLARPNPNAGHPGILIVCSRIAEVDQMVNTINHLAQTIGYALGYHSQLGSAKPTIDALAAAPVLVITHSAFEGALDAIVIEKEARSPWQRFMSWKASLRNLVIIDECLFPVEVKTLSLHRLRITFAAIPDQIRNDLRMEAPVAAFKTLLYRAEEIFNGERSSLTQMIQLPDVGWNDRKGTFADLRKAMRVVRWDEHSVGIERDELHNDIKGSHDGVLDFVEAVTECNGWAFYSRRGGQSMLTSGRRIVPEDVRGVVVMDATARSNVVYEVFDRAEVCKVTAGLRTYGNVLLHVCRGFAVGQSIAEDPQQIVEPALRAVHEQIKGRELLVLTHKRAESVIVDSRPAGLSIKTGHWGAITGTNVWQELSAVLILGIPRYPEEWALATFIALQKPGPKWIEDQPQAWKDREDIKRDLILGQTITDIVQGINRIRCRRVIDVEGNCDPCDVFIVLGRDKEADLIVEGIKSHMPGIKIRDWDVPVDRPRRILGRPGSMMKDAIDATMYLFEDRPSGLITKAEITSAVPQMARKKVWTNFLTEANNPNSMTAKRMEELRVERIDNGAGRATTFNKSTKGAT